MVRLICSQFDEFEQALRGVDGRYLLKSRGTQQWRLSVEDFGGMTGLVASNGAAAIFQGALPDAYALLIGLSRTDTCIVNGDRLCEHDIVWVPPGHEFHAPAEDGVSWLSLLVPRAEVFHWVGSDFARLDRRFLGYRAGRADAIAVRQVAGLITRAIEAATRPDVLPPQDRRSALRGQLTDAVLAVLQSVQPRPCIRRGRPRADGRARLNDVVHLIDRRLDQPVWVADICEQVGVSATTLRKVFHERLGMSPHRYLMLRRLHAIHSALKEAAPADTVSSICSRFGVWDFGRFAAQFRQVFGILPSAMLRRAPGRRAP